MHFFTETSLLTMGMIVIEAAFVYHMCRKAYFKSKHLIADGWL